MNMNKLRDSYKEIIFQVILNLIVFSFYSFERDSPGFETYQFWFYLNYALAALLINYLLLPRFYYRERYLLFTLCTLAVFTGVVVVEEMVLEKIFFPDTRGVSFQGSLYSLMAIFPVIIILSGFKFAWDALQKQQEVRALRASIEESELQFLKSQINPHFLFNNLNNLYSYAIENSPKTPSIILELSSVLRYMLYDCREQYVFLSKEIEQLENFTRLYQLQVEERGEVVFNAPDLKGDYHIAPLILIVFIENAFKHSQSCQSHNISIKIDIGISDEGWLEFRCRNNHQALHNTDHIPHGIGLENVRKRLRLLYPNKHQLSIKKQNERFEVYLRLKLSRSRPS